MFTIVNTENYVINIRYIIKKKKLVLKITCIYIYVLLTSLILGKIVVLGTPQLFDCARKLKNSVQVKCFINNMIL